MRARLRRARRAVARLDRWLLAGYATIHAPAEVKWSHPCPVCNRMGREVPHAGQHAVRYAPPSTTPRRLRDK